MSAHLIDVERSQAKPKTSARRRVLQSLGRRLTVPLIAFLNDVGASRIMVGVREFECIGASPPHDHPHIFLEMDEGVDVLCPYCATWFIFDGALARRETNPPNCCRLPTF
ncbi:MAG: zinc-finger domain-containing protein [Pseudomonadota bacterium]